MERFAAVVGGINLDIGGRSLSPLVPGDSNPGRVTVSLGGVGRNIAHNLRLLDVAARFLTAYGDDYYADRFEASCRELGIDLSGSVRVPGAATSSYLYLADSDGEMALAVSDMEICERITPEFLFAGLPLLRGAGTVILDTNIPEASVAWLARHSPAPLFADPVSTAKAGRLLPVLDRIHTLKPNRMEAELLSGVRIADARDCITAARALLRAGVQRVFLSLGADGVLAADRRELLRVPGIPAAVRNTTGAGDAFMAALARAYCDGLSLADSCRFASAAASLTVECGETVNPALSLAAVRERMKAFSVSPIPQGGDGTGQAPTRI